MAPKRKNAAAAPAAAAGPAAGNDTWEDVWATDTGAARSGVTLGIDLGTSNSAVALWHPSKSRAKALKPERAFQAKSRTMPSVALFEAADGAAPSLVGTAALQAHKRSPGALVMRGWKRSLGRVWDDDEGPFLDALRRALPYETERSATGGIGATRGGGGAAAAEAEAASVAMLRALREAADEWLKGGKLGKGAPRVATNCVVGVPAHFSEAQRFATRRAAVKAGFKRASTLCEPTAAATAYGLFVAGAKTVGVFDLGGGTCDVCVMRIDEGKFNVLGIAGDVALGGDDFDTALAATVAAKRTASGRGGSGGGKSGKSASPVVPAELREAARVAKEALSEATAVDVPHPMDGSSVALTRADFEAAVKPLVARCVGVLDDAVRTASAAAAADGRPPVVLDELVLVGGGSRVPAVRAALSAFVGEAVELCVAARAECCVAEGCAIRGAVLDGVDKKQLSDVLMMDVLPCVTAPPLLLPAATTATPARWCCWCCCCCCCCC